jgi:hypothetical protein
LATGENHPAKLSTGEGGFFAFIPNEGFSFCVICLKNMLYGLDF